MKVCLGDNREGVNSGETQSEVTLMPTFFLCLSVSPLKERLSLVLDAARPLLTPGCIHRRPKNTGR